MIDVQSNEIIADGLSMPNKPRVFHGELLLLQSGTGELGLIDMPTGDFEPIAWFPGFPRALDFIGMHAIVGTSMAVEPGVSEPTLLGERLEDAGVAPRCGLFIVNLLTGKIDHWLEIEGIVEDIASVAALPDVLNPMAIGFRSEEIRYTVRPEYF